ncbi:DUF1631 family protein [Oxalobacteraceae bacterium OM1]|nr:DUF1631 family protein [Oxalobacteraceae bacterium OM1]
MQETEYKRLIQSSKDRATFGFLALVQRAMQDAEKDIAQRMIEARTPLEQSTLSAVRHFLRQDGNQFLRRVDALYRTYLDRAMQTMYVDFRPGLKKVSASELSLVDDEVMTNQIEVGRLAQRMRDANEESIGRLNVIIAQMHGQHDAKERENPFRPYLLARPVYEAIREIATDEQKAKTLFDYLSNALVEHLPGYYSAVREVFEDAGMRGKFVAVRSRMSQFQRYFGAAPVAPGMAGMPAAHLNDRVLPNLQRLYANYQAAPDATAKDGDGDAEKPATVDEFVRKIFNPGRSPFRGARAGQQSANPIVEQLGQFQKQAAEDSSAAREGNQLFALRDKLDLSKASGMERLTVDVIAMLFEYIVGDEQIPELLRQSISRLQIPLLKAAMLDQDLLHDETHPARLLLNRLASAAIAADPQIEAGQATRKEIDRVVDAILSGFDQDLSIFARSLEQFEAFKADLARHEDSATTVAIDCIEASEKISVLLTNVTTALCDVLLPLSIDKRISDFAIAVWPHVLVQAAWQDAEQGHPLASQFLQYRNLLAELIWSIEEKSDPADRAALIKQLPGIVKRFNAALRLIQLPEDEVQEILDLLMNMHTAVLRPAQRPAASDSHTLAILQQDLGRIAVAWDRVTWNLDEPPQARAAIIEEVIQRKGVKAELHIGEKSLGSTEADREFLVQTYLLGTRVEMRREADAETAQLVWISTHRSLYLFKRDKDRSLAIHTSSSLLEALREGTIFPVEYAPVFERAVESLLFGAEKLAGAA